MDGLKSRKRKEVEEAIERAKQWAQEKKVPLTAERLAASLDMDIEEFRAIVSGEATGENRGERQIADRICAAWREALASVVEYAMQRGNSASMPMMYLKNSTQAAKKTEEKAGPVYFVGEEALPE